MTKAAGAGLFVLLASMAMASGASAQPTPGRAAGRLCGQAGDTLIGLGRAYLNRPGDYRHGAEGQPRPAQASAVGSQLNIDAEPAEVDADRRPLIGLQRPGADRDRRPARPARIGMPLAEGQR
jgi:hypothetical protein